MDARVKAGRDEGQSEAVGGKRGVSAAVKPHH